MFRKDSLRLGIILGFLAPVLGLVIYYFLQFRMYTVDEFLYVILSNKSLLTGIISICLVANAIVFTLFINKRSDRTARGVFIATCIYAIIALIIKLFL